MIISKTQVQNLLKVYETNLGTTKVAKVEASQPVTKQDDVSISEASKLKQKVMQAVNQAPDIRTDRVDEIKQKLAAGTNEISDSDVAQKMIERAIVDRLA
ncbi:MAG TPA: flagellar biosynthesis anti-sigma factor FlgM [Syntrophomonadaceae bacterium]|nr:flagellar biosynthesis anti-sigma factor FlgM [Syntrophomonadaceae bacterium]